MSELAPILGLLLVVAAGVFFLRAVYGLFAWTGRRKTALLQLVGIPVATFAALAVIIGLDEASPPAEGTTTAELPEEGTESGATILGQWCFQEPSNESLDRIITISERPEGQLFATWTLPDSEFDQELARGEDGRFGILGGGGDYYVISDDSQTLSIMDGDGLIGEALAHTPDQACHRPPGTAAAEREAEEQANACRNDLQCWGEKHMVEATVRCRSPIERSANFSMEWTDRWFEPKISHMRWRDIEAGIITYIGDRARFQNGFGAWQNVIYECDYHTLRETVVDINVRPGRIN